MTFEKQCLIETGDIIAVRYECVKCHAAIVVPIEKLNGEQLATYSVSTCVYCREPSKFEMGTNEIIVFANFIDSLKQIREVMKGRGRKLQLQIKCEHAEE